MNLEKIIKIIFIILFIIFITIYISYNNGYYEYELHKRVELTKEQIEKFENDVKNNNKIDINDYTSDTSYDYSNNISKLSASFSDFTSKYVKEGIKGIFTLINSLLT